MQIVIYTSTTPHAAHVGCEMLVNGVKVDYTHNIPETKFGYRSIASRVYALDSMHAIVLYIRLNRCGS